MYEVVKQQIQPIFKINKISLCQHIITITAPVVPKDKPTFSQLAMVLRVTSSVCIFGFLRKKFLFNSVNVLFQTSTELII